MDKWMYKNINKQKQKKKIKQNEKNKQIDRYIDT